MLRYLDRRRGLGYTNLRKGKRVPFRSDRTAFAFPGDEREARALAIAVSANCISPGECGQNGEGCPAHEMLLDRHAVEHLVFARRMAHLWIAGEWRNA